MVSASLQALESLYPDRFAPHPNIVIGFGIAGAGLLVAAFILWLRDKPSDKETTTSPSIDAPINVQVNPVFHNSPVITASPTISPVQSNEQNIIALSPAPTSSPQKSALQVEKPEFLLLRQTRIAWHNALPGTLDAKLGAVAWVHNPTADEGEQGTEIRSVVASLVYRGDNRTLATIPTAYWLEESAYQVDFKAGERRAIVLGILPNGFSGPLWLGAENTRRTPFRLPRSGGIVNVSGPKYREMLFGKPKEVEVSIVSDGVTLKKFSVFIVSRGQSRYDLTLEKPE